MTLLCNFVFLLVDLDADPQKVIPVNLPANKLKSADCPLPGATPIAGPSSTRSRKTKPQPVLYGGDNDGSYEYSGGIQLSDHPNILTNGGSMLDTGSGATGVTMASGAPLDITELGPQEIEILENVLQSEQAREIRELLESYPVQEDVLPTPGK